MALIYRRNPILRHTSGALYAPLLPLPYGVSAPGEWWHGPVLWIGNLNASLDRDLEVQRRPSLSLFKGLRMDAGWIDT